MHAHTVSCAGEVVQVDLTTLAAAPDGSYFKGLLRFYGLDPDGLGSIRESRASGVTLVTAMCKVQTCIGFCRSHQLVLVVGRRIGPPSTLTHCTQIAMPSIGWMSHHAAVLLLHPTPLVTRLPFATNSRRT